MNNELEDTLYKYTKLTKKQEDKLLKTVKGRKVVIKNLSAFVISICKEYLPLIKNQSITFLDLYQEGMYALCEAVGKYSPKYKNKFYSFAVWYVKKRIIITIKFQWQIKFPKYLSTFHRETDEVLSCGKEFKDRYQIEMISNDIYSSIDIYHLQDLEFEKCENRIEFWEIWDGVCCVLNEEEKNILLKRNGFDNDHKYSLKEIGKEYGRSREWVRLREREALEKIREYLKIGE